MIFHDFPNFVVVMATMCACWLVAGVVMWQELKELW